ncbi:hypothetical protein [Bradyrhizobium sp. Leo121]|uniref:hypothetical protein n=1 Tax=Bradyrhizobium sp. Leo121 TaxID=1571195 RepID=UPI00102A064B|nr:hypothetical protein [Bradyrhizobium sp. Leo121]
MRKPVSRSTQAQVAGFSPSESLLRAIVAWIDEQEDKPGLSEAISRLVQLGLTSHADQDRQKQSARKMAGDTIDGIGDTTTTADDRAVRKRDLLDGPKEFDRVRIDRPKRSKPTRR